MPKPLTLTFEVSVPPEMSAGSYGYSDTVEVTFKSGYHPFPTGQEKEFAKEMAEFLADCYDEGNNVVKHIKSKGGVITKK